MVVVRSAACVLTRAVHAVNCIFPLLRALRLERLICVLVAILSACATLGARAQAQTYTPGQFAVGPDGAATYTIPIQVPPGTAGMQPNLALVYNSQGGNGLIGVGWSLRGLSTIHRCGATFVQDGFRGGVKFDTNDRFCLDGQRLIATKGGLAYGAAGQEYRTENESFTKIVANGSSGSGPMSFTAWTKSGQIIQYGQTVNVYANNSAYPTVAAWPVQNIADRAGNAMSFEYHISGNEFRPASIKYGGNTTTGSVPYASVHFTYESRGDSYTTYIAGASNLVQFRLTGIKTCLGQIECVTSAIVKEYRLSYESVLSPSALRSRLSTITECSPTTCLPATAATYSSVTTVLPSSAPVIQVGGSDFDDLAYAEDKSFGDFNRDGIPDFAALRTRNTGFSGWIAIGNGNGTYQTPIYHAINTNDYGNVRDESKLLGDLNHDGLTDLMVTNQMANGWYVDVALRNQAGAYVAQPRIWLSTVITSSDGTRWADHVCDVNGDGKSDLCTVFTGSSGLRTYTALGNGNGTFQAATGGTLNTVNYGDDYLDRKHATDVNNDGLTDIVVTSSGSFGWFADVALGQGNGSFTTPFRSSLTVVDFGSEAKGVIIPSDLNGDGTQDLIRIAQTSGGLFTNVAIGRGDGTFFPAVNAKHTTIDYNSTEDTATTGDFNGDGKADVLSASVRGGVCYVDVLIGNGNGTFQLPYAAKRLTDTSCVSSRWRGDTTDLNVDGKSDITMRFRNGANLYVATAMMSPSSSTTLDFPDLARSITTGVGMENKVGYKAPADTSVYTPSTGSTYPITDIWFPSYLVSAVESSNGVSGTLTSTYAYDGAKAHLRGRGMLGFAKLTVTQPTSDPGKSRVTTTIYNQTGRGSISPPPANENDLRHVGTPTSIVTSVGGIVLSESTNTLSQLGHKSTYPGVYFEFVGESVEKAYVPNDAVSASTLVTTTTTTTEYSEATEYGNPTKITVSTRNDTNGEVHTKTTVNYYKAADTTNWIIGRLSCAAVTSAIPSGTSQTRTSSFEYRADGLLQSETIEPGTTCPGSLQTASTDAKLRLTTSYGYDAYGNKQSATVTGGVSGNESYVAPRTSYTYFEAQGVNPAGRFPTRAVNALGHQEKREFDSRFGGMTKLTGPNNVVTSWGYDTFGRKTSESRADGTSTNWSYATSAAAVPGFPQSSHQPAYYVQAKTVATAAPNTTLAPTVTKHFDILDREITTVSQTATGAAVYSVTEYDSFGRVKRTARPALSGQLYWATPAYDAIGRVLSETAPSNGVTYYSYNGFTTTITPPVNVSGQQNVTRKTKNSQGQLTEVINAYGTAIQSRIVYAYDCFGNLTQTTDQLGNVTPMGYDLRGRKTSMIDRDMGFWEYKYDALGQLVWQQDPVARAAAAPAVTILYDLLGRMTRRTEPSLTSNWYYDVYKDGSACSTGKGKLCEVDATNGYRRVHSYDSIGREIQTAYYQDGTAQPPYLVDSSYGGCTNGLGKLCTLTYPTAANGSRLTIKNTYSANTGFLTEVRNADGTLYWAGTAQDADLNWKQDALGNTVTTVRAYDLATGRLQSINAGGGTVQDHTFVFDTLGNLSQRHDNNSNSHETFTYDALNRLTGLTMTGTTALTKSYGYNVIGNITSKSDVGTLNYPLSGGSSVRPHAVSSVTGTVEGVVNPTYTYDANGNMKTALSGARSFNWYSFNMVQDITYGGSTTSFTYDADHNRIREINANGTTVFVNPGNALLFEKHSYLGTDNFKHYIPTPVGVVAVYTQTKSATVNTSDIKYLHKDHLGSTVVVTSGNGISPVQVLERLSYDPWGKRTLAQGGSASVTAVASKTFSVGSSAGSTTLAVSPGSVAAGGTVTVSWSGIASPTGSNWIGLYTPGAAAANHNGNWMYVNCSKTAGAAFPSGSCAFPIPSGLTAGGYELRLYTSSWALLASTSLTITAASSGATINVTPGSGVVAGSTVTVTWSGLPSPAASDRIGLYVAGAQSWLDWIYLSCSKTAGSASASGSCAFTLPATLANGSYEMRLLKSSGAAASFTDRGFTGHEHVKTAGDGIIHMNGRVYDANLGRFLSPDPYISLPTNSQDFNRYSYVLNNPLSLTDPTGYSWLSKLWKKVVRPFIAYTVGTLLCGNPFCGAALSGAVQGYSATHTFEGALRGAGASLIAQGVVSGIGALANEIGGASSSYWNMLAGAEPEIYTMSDTVVTATRVRTIESTFFEILTSPTKLAGAVASAYASAAATISSSQTLSLVTNVASGFIPGVDAWRAFTTPGASTFDKVLGVTSLVPGGGKLVALGIKGASRGLAHLVSKAPMEALGDVGGSIATEGVKVFRVWGDEAGAWGRSWTTVDPRTMSNFRDVAGLPIQNSGRFLSEGVLESIEGVTARGALPLHGTTGGLPELLIPNPSSQIRLQNVQGLTPEF